MSHPLLQDPIQQLRIDLTTRFPERKDSSTVP